MDVATVATSPLHHLIFAEDLSLLDVLSKTQIAAFVLPFCDSDGPEGLGDFSKSFVLGHLREGGIHLGPLIILARCGGPQVFLSRADHPSGERGRNLYLSPFEELEKPFGVFFLIVCGLGKNCWRWTMLPSLETARLSNGQAESRADWEVLVRL